MAKLKNKMSYILALIAPVFAVTPVQADEPKVAGAEDKASEEAQGTLSAGSIAAAVAAAAAIIAVTDDDDKAAAPAPTPAPTPVPACLQR